MKLLAEPDGRTRHVDGDILAAGLPAIQATGDRLCLRHIHAEREQHAHGEHGFSITGSTPVRATADDSRRDNGPIAVCAKPSVLFSTHHLPLDRGSCTAQ